MPDFDAIIIGTGQAGPSLARRLAGAGMKVAVIERKLFGGTCVNTGCTPTKTLVASAYAAHHRAARRRIRRGDRRRFGVDMRRVKARKDAIVAASRNGRRALAARALQDMHGLSRPRPVRIAAASRGRRRAAEAPTRSSSMSAAAPLVPPMPGHRRGAAI